MKPKAVLLLTALVGRGLLVAQNSSVVLPAPPEVRSPFVLSAVNDPVTGKTSFSFDGREIPPVIRTVPGGQIRLKYLNHIYLVPGNLCRWSMYQYDESALSRPSCFS
jgi:hypothetical protein